ncbi:hypothetical protein AB0436_10760 [Streptomyces sp. NPDC051322]|uniref:hypothetical protein n=1 Tax=Streptomyces sp. NPDC051322 TaxID=3154645 RepID=UPI00344D37B3
MNTSIDQLIATADRLLTDAPATMGAGRYRGAAFALRTALEIAVAATLLAPPISIERVNKRVNTRAQMLCLRGCTEAETARRARAVWVLLCLGCHYHQYEIGPTQDQVRAWRLEVIAVLGLLAA